jgi:hypothetical protein
MTREASTAAGEQPDPTADVPHRFGMCEWCLHETTVYAYILWVCRDCLLSED